MVIQCWLLPVLCILCVGVLQVSSNSEQYVFTAPKILQSAATEKFCINFHNVEFDMDVLLTLFPNDKEALIYRSMTAFFSEGKGRCFDFRVPYISAGEAKLCLNGTSVDSDDYVFSACKTVLIKQNSLMTFIQTDKPIYKPGQKVQFRILSVDAGLKPQPGKISKVFIQDPANVRVAQFLDVETEQGLASLSFQLSAEPVLGDWKISALIGKKTEETKFTVDEYVLPKYEVQIKPPAYVRLDAETIEGEICAEYTYGKPVKGDLFAELCIVSSYHRRTRPCAVVIEEINGCAKFTLDATHLQLANSSYSLYNGKLNISATVTEEGTGVVLTGSDDSAKIERTPLKIEISEHSPEHYKPGLNYNGKAVVKNPDGSRAPDEMITIKVESWQTDKRFEQNYTSNENGEIFFTIPPFGSQLPSISIQASAPEYKYERVEGTHEMYEPRSFHSIKQWFSPTGSFLQIEPIREEVECGSTLTVDVAYTTEANTKYKFYYELMSRGNIIESGHKSHHFKIHDYIEPVAPSPLVPLEEETEEEVVEEVIVPKVAVPLGAEDEEGESVVEDILPPEPPYPTPTLPTPTKPTQVPLPGHVSRVKFEIDISAAMAPLSRLLVYYINEDGEMVSDSVEFNVQKCWANKVEMQFRDPMVKPGEATVLQLKASPRSLCAVGVVDKSVHLLKKSNQLDPAKIFEMLKGYDINENNRGWESDDYCNNQEEVGNPEVNWRRKRSVIWPGGSYSKYYDAIRAFKTMGMIVMTDTEIETRPCERDVYRLYNGGGWMRADLIAQDSIQSSPRRKMVTEMQFKKEAAPLHVKLRKYFPETWLWDLETVGDSGEVEVERTIPDTITQWMGSTFCTNTDTGLGVSSVTSIRAFKPFFLSYTLPYSVIRGEKVNLLVTVFNYLTKCLTIELTLKKSTDFDVINQERTVKICVCGNEAKTHSYKIVPQTLGKIKITVKAISVNEMGVCGNQLMSEEFGATDAMVRELLVEPEGSPEEYSYSTFFCPKDSPISGGSYAASIDLPLPDDLVPGSARATVSVIGDIMGPALSGIEKLVQMPYGCGEQNMINFVPNIVVMDYLGSTGQLTDEIKGKATEYMKAGYQREQTYRHDDGSYSAFGKSDDSGSMFLTAYVVKSFAQARDFIYIDEESLAESVKWFSSKQFENGCFPAVGTLHHKAMSGGLASAGDSNAGLTAYVLISMLEAGNTPQENQPVKDAMQCLDALRMRGKITDTYTIALMAYAYSLYYADELANPAREQVMEMLESKAVSEGGMKYWQREGADLPKSDEGRWSSPYTSAPSAEVEMTSYALMAYVSGEQSNAVADGLPVVRWIAKQRNSNGGFKSTQDTVIALQALAMYAKLVSNDKGGVVANIHGQELDETFSVSSENSLVLQKAEVGVLPNTLILNSTGTGCALFQASVRYNIKSVAVAKPVFDLQVHVANHKENCKKRKMNVCVKYTGEDQKSNMAVVEVRMVSGWIPVKATLKNLKNRMNVVGFKRYEVDKDSVNFYFDSLTEELGCLSFDVEQYTEVEDTEARTAKVYDYYETTKELIKYYKISPGCAADRTAYAVVDEGSDELRPLTGTKEDLPHLTREEYEEETRRNPFSQKRLPDGGFPGPLRQCTGNMVWEDCGSACNPESCADPPALLCTLQCVPKCQCPFRKPVLHNGTCIERSECPETNATPRTKTEKEETRSRCPLCVEDQPGDFIERVCANNKAYKVSVGRKGNWPIKLTADLRPAEKARFGIFSKYALQDGCECKLITEAVRGSRVLISINESQLTKSDDTHGEVALDGSTLVMPFSKALEREIRQTVRRGGCSTGRDP